MKKVSLQRMEGMAVDYLGLSACEIKGLKNTSTGEESEDLPTSSPIGVVLLLEDAYAPGGPQLMPPLVLTYHGFKALLKELQQMEEHICACHARGEISPVPG